MGIEVWFDKIELRGGDVWERQIEDRIHECRLFIPLISAHTERRDEGCFRREWSLTVDLRSDQRYNALLRKVNLSGVTMRVAQVAEPAACLQPLTPSKRMG